MTEGRGNDASNRTRLLFGGLLLLHLLPLWLIRYFPTQDGAAHLYNARLLLDLLDPAHFQIRQFYEFNPALHPNLLAHAALAVLQLVFPPHVAEKLLASLLVAALPLSLAFLTRAVHGRVTTLSLLGFVFAWNNLLVMGFYGFCLALPLALVTLGSWWSRRDRPDVASVAVLNGLLVATFLAHFFPFALVLAILVAAAGWIALLGWARGELGVGAALRRLATQVGVLLPSLVLAADYALRTRSGGAVRYVSADKLHAIFFERMTIASYTPWHEQLAPVLLGALALALLLVLVERGRPRLRDSDVLLVIVLGLGFLYFQLPRAMNQAGWINDRVYLFAMLLFAAWLAPLPRRARPALGAVVVAVSLVHAGRLTLEMRRLQPELAELTAAAPLVEPHSTVHLDFHDRDSDAFPAGIRYVHPFGKFHSYYGLAAPDVALFENYEVVYPYFPIQARPTLRTDPDYVVAWRHPAGSLARYRDAFEPIHRSPHLVLLRRRAAEPDARPWDAAEADRLRLRFGPGEAVAGSLELRRGAIWRPGQPGWLRAAPGDGVGRGRPDARDHSFRIDLPDGRYRVVCRLTPPEGEEPSLAIYTGEGRVVPPRRISADDRELDFEVEVRDGGLVLVFHPPSGLLPARGRAGGARLDEIELERLGR